jgi:DNA-binding transcriptional LysR family regulator
MRATEGRLALRASTLALRAAAVRAGIGVGLLPCYAGDADPLLARITPPVTELGAEYWVIVHHDLRRAACVRAVIDWIRCVFEEHRDELAGAASQPLKALAAE